MVVDIAKLREQHGLVQAQAESRAVEAIQNRFGNVSYKQGHRRGFWDAMQFIAENPSALIPEPPTEAGVLDVLDLLDALNHADRISYDDYRALHDAVSIAPETREGLRL